MRKFEKEFRLQHPETIGETDKDFDNYNYTEFLESVLEKMAQPKEEQPEKIVRELPKVDEAGAIAVSISSNLNPKLTAQEEAMFIAGFQECVKYFGIQSKEIEKANELLQMYLDFCLIHSGDFDKKYGEMSEEDIQNKFIEFLEGTKTK